MKKESPAKNIIRYTPNPIVGLTDIQVASRFEDGLNNTVKQKYSKSYLRIILDNVLTIFNLLGLLVFISLIIIDKSKPGDFFFVFFYVANTLIGIIQEVRAKKCIDKLSLMTSKSTLAIRNGELVEILSDDIVLDDILRLGIGNQIPTDSKIVHGEIEVNESLLTGESIAVKKVPGDLILAGSYITSGVCTAQAIKVGKDNYIETLSAKAKQYKKPHSEIMNSLSLIIRTILILILPIAVFWLIKTIALTGDLAEAIYMTSTPVIGMIPAGMFLLTSVALALGIIKLARHNTLVQDLYSLEMLARVDTICFDKTGTITDGKMSIDNIEQLTTPEKPIGNVISSMLASLKDNNQTAIALYEHFGQESIYESESTLPFNSSRKFSAVTFKDIGTYAFGAPEFVLSNAKYKTIKSKVDAAAKKGLRVLVFAHSNKPLVDDVAPNDFSPIALITIADNIRTEVINTINWFNENGVQIKVISGDNPLTVSEISKRVGIKGAENYISLEGLPDDELYEIADKYTIFGRVSPEQKAVLVKALKKAGHITAMTGDGVNDILALKESDCAVTVASGSDAARNVSHIVLLDNNFNSMPKVVKEGRRVINNIEVSSSLFLMKTLFTMFLSIATLLIPYMDSYPYTLSNMLMFEVLVVGIPTFFLSLQPNDSMVKGKFINYIIKHSLPSALLMILSIAMIEVFRVMVNYYSPSLRIYETMEVYAFTFAGLINLFCACRPLNKYRSAVFFTSFVLIMTIIFLSLTTGIGKLLLLSPMLPVSEYWHHLLVLGIVLLLEIPLGLFLHKLFHRAKVYEKIADITKLKI